MCGHWERKSGILQEQQMLLTAESPSQPRNIYVFIYFSPPSLCVCVLLYFNFLSSTVNKISKNI